MPQLNVFEKNPEVGKRILERLLAGKLSSRKAVKSFAKHGIKSSASNIQQIVKRMRENFETVRLLIVDSPITSQDARIRMEAIREKLIGDGKEVVRVDYEKLIATQIADLEILKLSWGYDHRLYLNVIKLQTDIAIQRLKISPDILEEDVNDILNSFDWLTEFVNMLDKKCKCLNVKQEYIDYIASKQQL